MSSVKLLSDENFEDFIKSNDKDHVLIKFFAEWCMPCKRFAKTFDDFAMSADIICVEMNVDHSKEVAGKFAISSIPAMVLLKNGEKVDIKIGSLSLQALKDWVKEHTS